ncbi:DUF4192 domain-containing protein [Streptomyces sp. MS06]|uniref:DUF4192 domain-containing protein n=1 Tax=Streptomyces sp. MS06 TaxID=3385974 RepID=UPI00399F8BBE
MTNHGETTGSFGNDDVTGSAALPGQQSAEHAATAWHAAITDAHRVTLRTPSELADALPYLLGYRPEDSIVLVAVHDRDARGRFGGRARLGIPAGTGDWPAVARQLARGLVTGSERKGARPEQMIAYLCQEPAPGENGRQVMERLRPLAQQLRVECGLLDVPVIEALCIADGRFWSYCCTGASCCPPEGIPMGLPGTSVMAAAAAYAGISVRGTLGELRARLMPWETAPAPEQEAALDAAGLDLLPRMLDDAGVAAVAEETVELAERLVRRLAGAPPAAGMLPADRRDDGLLAHDEAARMILGLQDRTTRDRLAAWMEGDEAGPALRLWRALARRCVGPYREHAAAPLSLAGWVAWSGGDGIEAREALAMALGADPDYLFARLLHQAVNEGLDPETVRRCLRADRRARRRSGRAQVERPERNGRADHRPAPASPRRGGRAVATDRGPRPGSGATDGEDDGDRGNRAAAKSSSDDAGDLLSPPAAAGEPAASASTRPRPGAVAAHRRVRARGGRRPSRASGTATGDDRGPVRRRVRPGAPAGSRRPGARRSGRLRPGTAAQGSVPDLTARRDDTPPPVGDGPTGE